MRFNIAQYVLLLGAISTGCMGPRQLKQMTVATADSLRRDLVVHNSDASVLSPNSGRIFLSLSFSGGGTRAAAFSFGSLEQMAADTICVDSKLKSVADEIDVVSAVSGGSFTAAHYALFGSQGFEEFKANFLYYRAESELKWRSLTPPGLIALLSPTYGRSDIASDLWDEKLFHKATFGEVRNVPYLYINAADMESGSLFSFTSEELGGLCLDSRTFSVARAVAASSAVPGLLSPIVIRNEAASRDTTCSVRGRWIDPALKESATSEERRLAQIRDSYRRPERRYVHLVDGGVADNIGSRVPLRLMTGYTELASTYLLNDRSLDSTATFLYVVVDARPGDKRYKLGRSKSVPNATRALKAGADGPFGNRSFDSINLLLDQVRTDNLDFWRDVPDTVEHFQFTECYPPKFAHKTACAADVAFRQESDVALRDSLESVETTFQLPRETVDQLRRAGGRILLKNAAYQSLLKGYDRRKCLGRQ